MPELNSITDPASRRFVERLSCLLVIFSALGAAWVMIDPVFSFQFSNGNTLKIGGNGFSDQLKGAVITLVLIAGFSATISYWLGASNQGDKAQESVNNIAASAAPAQAAAVAAATVAAATGTAAPLKTENVDIVADSATITERKP